MRWRYLCPMKRILPLGRSRDDPETTSGPKTRTMKSMQGVFRTEGGRSASPFDTGSSRSSTKKLLPKAAPTSRAVRHADASRYRQDRSANQQYPDQSTWQTGRKGYAVPGYTRTFGNLPFSGSIIANGYPVNVQSRQILNFVSPPHLVFPLIEIDGSPLGLALMDFQRLGGRLITEGTPSSQVADPGLIDVTLYFLPREPGDPVNASTWTSEMLRSFSGTFSGVLLLACAACVTKLMCWFLVPKPENYAKIPSMMRPTDLQRIRPHPSWVDLMVFPSFRNALTNRVRDWIEPCMKARWEFLWLRSVEEALIRRADTKQLFLTPEFTAYVDNPRNWLMQRSILEDFPEVQESEINIASESSELHHH